MGTNPCVQFLKEYRIDAVAQVDYSGAERPVADGDWHLATSAAASSEFRT